MLPGFGSSEEFPAEFVELLPLTEPELSVESDPLVEPVLFDVEEPELSCSAPLETQPVIAAAIRAHAATEAISFFIVYSLPNSNN